MEAVIHIDDILGASISMRDGRVLYLIGPQTLESFRNHIFELRSFYDILTSEGQKEVLLYLLHYLTPHEISYQYLDSLLQLGGESGIDNQEKALEYFNESISIFLSNFPEVTALEK